MGTIKAIATIDGEEIEAEKTITVTRPSKLGNTYNTIQISTGTATVTYNLDKKLIDLANEFGIPPQIIKGQIEKETVIKFYHKSFRYEPVTVDYTLIFPGEKGNKDLRDKEPYKYYRLATVDGLSQGTKLNPDDISPRDMYILNDDNGDNYYSAIELIDANPSQNWGELPAGTDFTAQTTIASSYGLLQMLFTTAIQPVKWNGGNGGNPSELFNPDVILRLGSKYLSGHFIDSSSGEVSCEFSNYDQWEYDWKTALSKYNYPPSDADNNLYWVEVLSNAQKYLPQSPTTPSPSPSVAQPKGIVLAKVGGLVSNFGKANIKLLIPPEALTEDAKVLIIPASISTGQRIEFNLLAISSQNGKMINKLSLPATIILDYNSIDIRPKDTTEELAIFYNDRVDWQKIESKVDVNLQIVTAQVTNFGQYAIMPTTKATAFSFNRSVPNPFTPNNDGINDEVYFYYENPDDENVSIKIYDLSGSLVKELEIIDEVTPFWDGKNTDDKVMEGGVYIYQIKIGNNKKSGTIILAK